MEELTITIAPDGKVTIDALGFEGTSCEEATRELEAALGVVTDRDEKVEYRMAQQHQKATSG